ncbi:MAG: type IV toxin-antitoxin system AbiEi family antitoxin [Saprospiraceae bacterium]
MEKNNIITKAIDSLNRTHQIQAGWGNVPGKELDGEIEICIENQTIKLNFIARQELRQHQMPQLEKMASDFAPFMVIAGRIFPKLKDELIQKHIAYLESNGNAYIRQGAVLIWMDTHKPIQPEKEKNNRAFTKTGLQVVFHFMLNENYINQSYREIAGQTKVGLGNINYVMNGLKAMGFLIKLDKDHYKLINKKELLEKWISAYLEKLKPALKVGTFRFLKEADFINWRNVSLQIGKTWWGGEPAGDLYTNHLHPGELTLYTTETRNDLIKNYRLIPDDKGNVNAYKKFWRPDEENSIVVPPLLAYCDLINTNDRRCIETAQKIYDEFLQNKL